MFLIFLILEILKILSKITIKRTLSNNLDFDNNIFMKNKFGYKFKNIFINILCKNKKALIKQ